MSEFSESYHLRSERAEDAVEILRTAKRKGYVFQPVNGWVTFVVEKGLFEPDRRIVAAATCPLLHYVSAEDHGWSFALLDGQEALCRYTCDWDERIVADDSQYSRQALEEFIPASNTALLDAFEKKLLPEDFDQLSDPEPSKLFAQAMGLVHYDWLAYDYVASDFGKSPERFAGVVKVA